MIPRRVGALCGLVLALPAILGGSSKEAPPRHWRDGPVRYLLTDQEYRKYGSLGTDEARREFVERFWTARDPDPSTPENEFRLQFDALCQKADASFHEPGGPGWKTDRGRVLVLLGDPDSIRKSPSGRGRDREVWTYHHLPGGGSGPAEISFYRTRDGRFTLDSEDRSAGSVSAAQREEDRRAIREMLLTQYMGIPSTTLEAITDRLLASQRTTGLPRQEDRDEALRRSLRAEPRNVSSPTPEGTARMTDAAYFFESADGTVLTLLVLEFQPSREDRASEPGTARAPCSAVAWITSAAGQDEPAGASGPEDEIVLEPQPVAGQDGKVLFVGQAHVRPGSYGLRFAIVEPYQRRMTLRSVDLEVPGLGGGVFSASSVVPSERFGSVPAGGASAFAVGSEEVVPRPGGRFRRGEPLRIYLQVYDAAPSPRSGKPDVDVEFHFEHWKRGVFRPYGRPFVVSRAEGASMGLALPVGNWPSGDYRVVVELHDRVSGARTETSGSFVLSD